MVTLAPKDLALSPERLLHSSDQTPAHAGKKAPKTAGDVVELSNLKSSANPNHEAIVKLSRNLEKSQEVHASNILKIVNEYAPSVMKSLRAIIASQVGLTPPPQPSLEKLSGTLDAATRVPGAEGRVADVMSGVGLVPEGQRDKFLKAAEALLNLESKSSYTSGTVELNSTTGNYEASGVYSAEVNFDLFYSVSARSSLKAGEDSSGAFYDATYSVATKFEANFSLEIAGRFLSLADMAEKIDPKVLEGFSEAVAGLADFDGDALENFLSAAEKLFGEIEDGFGMENGALDYLEAGVKETARNFMNNVAENVKALDLGDLQEATKLLMAS